VLTTGFDKTVRLWDLASGKEQRCFKGHQGRACWAAFTPDGRRIVSCALDDDPTVRLWDVESGKQIRCSEPCKDGILCLAVLPDGRRCITCGQDCTVRLWQWK
jgi:WD40 repeat protein